MSIYDYSTTPSSNSTIDGTNIAEGCSPANINNAIRSLMADMAQLFSDTGGALDTTGSANTYVAASAQSFSAYSDGMTLRVRINVTNTGASTINVDSVGAASIKKVVGAAAADVAAGDLQAGGVYDLSYDSGNSYFILAGFTPLVFTAIKATDDSIIGGTGTPGARLEVYEPTDTKVIKLHGNSTSGAFMTMEDANTTGTGYVQIGALADAMKFTAGNVTVGTLSSTAMTYSPSSSDFTHLIDLDQTYAGEYRILTSGDEGVRLGYDDATNGIYISRRNGGAWVDVITFAKGSSDVTFAGGLTATLPTSNPGGSGVLWNDGGTVKIT